MKSPLEKIKDLFQFRKVAQKEDILNAIGGDENLLLSLIERGIVYNFRDSIGIISLSDLDEVNLI